MSHTTSKINSFRRISWLHVGPSVEPVFRLSKHEELVLKRRRLERTWNRFGGDPDTCSAEPLIQISPNDLKFCVFVFFKRCQVLFSYRTVALGSCWCLFAQVQMYIKCWSHKRRKSRTFEGQAQFSCGDCDHRIVAHPGLLLYMLKMNPDRT